MTLQHKVKVLFMWGIQQQFNFVEKFSYRHKFQVEKKKLNISCLEQTNINHNNSVKSFAPDSCLIMRAFSHQYKLKLYMPNGEKNL